MGPSPCWGGNEAELGVKAVGGAAEAAPRPGCGGGWGPVPQGRGDTSPLWGTRHPHGGDTTSISPSSYWGCVEPLRRERLCCNKGPRATGRS